MDPLIFNLDATPTPPCGTSRLMLRRLHTGELPAVEQARLTAHAEKCLDCQAVLADLRSEDAAFKTQVPWERFRADHQQRAALQQGLAQRATRLWKWILGSSAGLVVATATAILLLMPAKPVDPSEDIRTRLKGGGLGFVYQSPHGINAGREGEQLHEGDRIQFFVRAPSVGSSLVLLGVDGKGSVTLYHSGHVPEEAGHSAVPLAESLVLDDAVGPERFFALYGDPANSEELENAALHAAKGLVTQHADLTRVEALPLRLSSEKHVIQDSVYIVKVPR